MKKKYTLILLCLLTAHMSFALKPLKDYIVTPDSLGLNYKELQITTPDNYKLAAWALLPEKKRDNKTVMVLAYGDAMNMSYWLEQCAYFVQAGFTVVTFDYRGFGQSSPFVFDSNQLYYEEFATDLQSVATYVRANFNGYKVCVRAMSMGTIAATLACGNTPFDYFIGDSFVCDPLDMVDRLKKKTGRTFILPGGAVKYKEQLNKITTPMLVFAGTKDENTPLKDSKALIAGHPNRKLITYEGGHLQGIYLLSGKTFGEKYIAAIKSFINAK